MLAAHRHRRLQITELGAAVVARAGIAIGVKGSGQAADTKLKFLRRIPLDPMTNTRDWGLRSMQDDPMSSSWGGQNVFDVYTKSMDKAADGTPYSEW